MARDNQLLITAVVITGTVALIWSLGRDADPAVAEDPPTDPDSGPQKALADLYQEFDRLRHEVLPADITGSHEVSKATAARFTDLGNRFDSFAGSIERADPASEARKKRAIELAGQAHKLATYGPPEDAVMQHVPSDDPVPTQPSRVSEGGEPPFGQSPSRRVEGEPEFNSATSNVDKIQPGHGTNTSTSDRTGSDNAIFSTVPPRTSVPPSIPDQIEHADADQNASGFNIPQAAKQPDAQAPVTQSKPGTESFTSVDPEPENTDERLTSQSEGYGKVSAKRPKPRVAAAPFDVSFDTNPNAANMPDPTQNKVEAPPISDDTEMLEFRASIFKTAGIAQPTAATPNKKINAALFRVIMNRMKVAENTVEAKRLAQVMYSLKPEDGRTIEGKIWKTNMEAIDEEHRSRFGGKSMSGYVAGGATQARGGKRLRPSPPTKPGRLYALTGDEP